MCVDLKNLYLFTSLRIAKSLSVILPKGGGFSLLLNLGLRRWTISMLSF